MPGKIPTQAQVVIIGGGIVGCSVAYHLCKLGWKDVVLLERKTIASGTSWAAAGLLGQLWSTSALTKLAVYGADLYSRLEEETGQPTGYQRPGSIRVAQTDARKSEFNRSMAMAHAFGIEMEEISLAAAQKLPGFNPMTVSRTRRTPPRRWPKAPAWEGPACLRGLRLPISISKKVPLPEWIPIKVKSPVNIW
jgi:choline dehydrogenase-like flavoprotein